MGMPFKIGTWRGMSINHEWNGMFYACRQHGAYDESEYLHHDGKWHRCAGFDARFDTVEELLEAAGYELTPVEDKVEEQEIEVHINVGGVNIMVPVLVEK